MFQKGKGHLSLIKGVKIVIIRNVKGPLLQKEKGHLII